MDSSQPINCLPPEILGHVFTFLIASSESISNLKLWPFAPRRIDNLVAVTSVCRYWRHVAISIPALWSNVWEVGEYDARRSWGVRYIDRCPSGPLNVFADGSISDELAELLQLHGNRVQQLHITSSLDGRKALSVVRSLSAREVRHCAIELITASQNSERHASLFSEGGEALRSLMLDSVSFLPSDHFRSLTRLVMVFPGGPLWDLSDLMQFLSSVPKLEILDVTSTTRPPATKDIAAWDKVTLPRLEELSLHLGRFRGSVVFGRDIISRLALHPSCRRTITGVNVSQFHILDPVLHPPPDTPFKRLRVTLDGGMFSEDVTLELVTSPDDHA